MTEYEKMLSGETYDSHDEELLKFRQECRKAIQKFNNVQTDEEKKECLTEILGYETNAQVMQPFFCDYGRHIKLGNNVLVNYNCTFLDCNEISIGDDCLIAPNVTITTAAHPKKTKLRLKGEEFAKPVKIGRNVWIGANVLISAGVEIGDNCIIDSGSVVTKSIKKDTMVAGNPARPIKTMGE